MTALRRYRDEVGAKPSGRVRGRLVARGYDRAQRAARRAWPASTWSTTLATPLASVPIPGGAIEVLPSDAFDPAEAEKRIAAKRSGLEAEIERAERKLANEKFVERAPAAVVEEERRKLAEHREALERLGA